MAAGLSVGSMAMYTHCGRHVTGVSGSAAFMAATLAGAAARAPRRHRHTLVATDSVHRLVAEECAWRPLHGGHELAALAVRQQRLQTPPVFAPRAALECSSRSSMRWQGLKAVKHLLSCDVDQAREVMSGGGTLADGAGTPPPLHFNSPDQWRTGRGR